MAHASILPAHFVDCRTVMSLPALARPQPCPYPQDPSEDKYQYRFLKSRMSWHRIHIGVIEPQAILCQLASPIPSITVFALFFLHREGLKTQTREKLIVQNHLQVSSQQNCLQQPKNPQADPNPPMQNIPNIIRRDIKNQRPKYEIFTQLLLMRAGMSRVRPVLWEVIVRSKWRGGGVIPRGVSEIASVGRECRNVRRVEGGDCGADRRDGGVLGGRLRRLLMWRVSLRVGILGFSEELEEELSAVRRRRVASSASVHGGEIRSDRIKLPSVCLLLLQ
ncbi:uridine-cytidine kinase 1-A [Striga asiatica]|uniref:Uridine-cytidine kinase 1-A n=1 Tax=Striga asiatica TaxID=4170 RepID=A0A5A7RJP4_STRAF|nr:uridine-cytidine kinase 1-A [Striga asiatica]